MNNNNEKREALYHHPTNVSWFYNVEHSLNSLWSRKHHSEVKKVSVREIFALSILFTIQSLSLALITLSWTSLNLF